MFVVYLFTEELQINVRFKIQREIDIIDHVKIVC